VYQRCAGVDVHQAFLVVCLSIVEGGTRRKEIRHFRNETADLLELRSWLLQEQCQAVGMEARACIGCRCIGVWKDTLN
jgi:transposase